MVGYMIAACVVPIVGTVAVGVLSGIFDSSGALVAPLWQMLALVLVPVLLIVGLLLLPYLDSIGRARLEDLQRIKIGEQWLHWHFTSDEWARFRAAEGEANVQDAQQLTMFGLGIAAVAGAIGFFVSGLILASLVFGGILLASLLPALGSLLNRSRASGKSGADVYVTKSGILAAGHYTPINLDLGAGYGQRLTSVNLTGTEPLMLDFSVLATQSRISGALAGGQGGFAGTAIGAALPNASTGGLGSVRIPVPPGKAAEAEALIARFKRDCGI